MLLLAAATPAKASTSKPLKSSKASSAVLDAKMGPAAAPEKKKNSAEDEVNVLKDRLAKGRERLDQAREAFAMLCADVQPPKGELQYIHYFCGNSEIADDLQRTYPLREAFYKATVSLLRAYANISDELEEAGYTAVDIQRIKGKVKSYAELREAIRLASGETLDLKAYEADMRHLIDTYIQADEPRKISPFDGIGLLDLIVHSGISTAIAEKMAGKVGKKQEAVAEAIENNVRQIRIRHRRNR